MDGGGEEMVEQFIEPFLPGSLGQFRLGTRDENASARLRIEQPLAFQFGINPGDRVRIDDQRPREVADRGEPFVGRQAAPGRSLPAVAGQSAGKSPIGWKDRFEIP